MASPTDPHIPIPTEPGAGDARTLAALERRIAVLERAGNQPGAWGLEPWHVVGDPGEPTLQTNWTVLGSAIDTPRFFKDAYGFVHLEGSLQRGADAPPLHDVVFTLPAEYRPPRVVMFAVGAQPTTRLVVNTAGDVQGSSLAAGGAMNLDGVTFRVI